MRDLRLCLALGDYDRVHALHTGEVRIGGVDPVFLKLEPEEIFFRAVRQRAFDVCELSLSSFCVMTANATCPYVGIPVFPSRAFRHNCFFIRTDRGIARPEDLRGKRVGLPEYQLTANVWMRDLLEQDYGVRPAEIDWRRGGYEQPGRHEKIALSLPADVRLESIPDDRTISAMLAEGELDALIGPRAPACFERGNAGVARLFPDPVAASLEWYARRRIFPIMHLLGVRRTLAEEHPWLPGELLKAFARAKDIAVERLFATAAANVTLPLVEEHARAARAAMGTDFWSYGIDANRPALDAFLTAHHRQGLSDRLLSIDELFHPSTHETVCV